jgi:hypothetical protein
MAVIVPSWFKGRQGKAEETAPQLLRLTAPNLNEWFLGLRCEGSRWLAFLRRTADGPDEVVVTLDEGLEEYSAWEAAFEVYRNHVII